MLIDAILEAQTEAMRRKDAAILSAIRMIRSEIKYKESEAGAPEKLPDEAVIQLLKGMRKKHRESIEQFRLSGREDLAAKEEAEVKVIEGFLPPEVDEAAIESAVKAVIAEVGAASPREMGKVMGPALKRLAGGGANVDGAKVSAIAKRLLGG